MRPRTDRGKSRQLAAQIAVLFLERRKNGYGYFSDTNKRAIDEYYYTQLDFDSSSPDCKRLRDIFNKLATIFKDWKAPRLVAHNAIHLVLFVDSLLDDYTNSWQNSLFGAQEKFAQLFAEAKLTYSIGEESEAWTHYGGRTRSATAVAENIRHRHEYYSVRMVEFLGDSLTPLDPKRSFNDLERQVIYWRDGKRCQVCDCDVDWAQAHIHHVVAHSDGGKTTMSNGVLVHDQCHPRGEAARDFAKQYRQQ